MAVCPACNGEMLNSVSCTTDPFIIAGKMYEPLPWGQERKPRRSPAGFPCKDCATPLGGIHHHGCDVEECPVCHGQAISCSCDERGEWDHYPRRRQRCALHSPRPTV